MSKPCVYRIFAAMLAVLVLASLLVACKKDNDSGEDHTHTYLDGICSICGAEEPGYEVPPDDDTTDTTSKKDHQHIFDDEWHSNDETHMRLPLCCNDEEVIRSTIGAHTFEYGYCSVCGRPDRSAPYLYFSETDDGYAVVGYSTYPIIDDYIIPAKYKGLPVTEIGEEALIDCPCRSITIPDSVKRIGDNAFNSCRKLTAIVIPDSVESIGETILNGCNNIENATVPYLGRSRTDTSSHAGSFVCFKDGIPGSLRTLVITGGTFIDEYAFYGCELLTSVTLPEGLKTIGKYAFRNTGLTELRIPDSVTFIGEYAFYNTELAGELRIPGSVHIEECAFTGCKGLTRLTIENGVEYIGKYAFAGCSGLTEIVIPDSVTCIGYGSFRNCSALTKITVPFTGSKKGDTENTRLGSIFGYSGYYTDDEWKYTPPALKTVVVTGGSEIAPYAFYGFCQITEVICPQNITSIGEHAFGGCRALTSFHIPYGVKSIGQSAFSGSGLTSVTIPGSVEIMGEAFSYCHDLISVTVENGVTDIGREAFNHCEKLRSVTLSESVRNIEDYAFYRCWELTDITFGGVTRIGMLAFGECEKITNLTLGDSVTSIAGDAFYSCTGLLRVEIPATMTEIADSAFSECYKLVEVVNHSSLSITGQSKSNGMVGYYAQHITTDPEDTWLFRDGNGYIFCRFSSSSIALIGYDGEDKTLSLPTTLPDGGMYTSIYKYAFYGRRDLTGTIRIPKGVVDIYGYAFYGCQNLSDIIISDSVRQIGGRAFSGCNYGADDHELSIIVPDSVITIGSGAFACGGLAHITLPFVGNQKEDTANAHFGNIFGDRKEASVPESLKSVTITGNVAISPSAFSGCTGLEMIVLESGVTKIGDNAFSGCTALKKISIPGSVSGIGAGAFSGCTALTEIRFGGTAKVWEDLPKGDAWNSNIGDCKVYCSDETVDL